VLDPSVWFTNLGTERDWGDVAIASPHTNNRAIPEHMGRVVGGGSSINATIWARPFKNDLEFWAQASGDKAWGYESGLEVYRRMENWQGKPDARYRGKNGPVWCQPANNPHPVANGLLQACKTLGYPVLDDQNGQREEGGIGFALMNQIIRDGRRQSMARSYLYPVLSRPNVTVVVNTHVDKLALSGTKVTGVHINRGGTQSVIGANTEVIICSGGINTPKLLMLSGIGDDAQLRQHGIFNHCGCRKRVPAVNHAVANGQKIQIGPFGAKAVDHGPHGTGMTGQVASRRSQLRAIASFELEHAVWPDPVGQASGQRRIARRRKQRHLQRRRPCIQCQYSLGHFLRPA
jgi:choline dehydrogenase-like flavoprotein